MYLEDLQRKLIAAARAHPPADRVPYAFEKRVMALLRTRPFVDQGALWARALWRGAAACLVFMLLFGVLSVLLSGGSPLPKDLSQDFEKTLLASVAQDTESASFW
jgi:hypothetical protein